ncbi:hypothetical protein LZ31DRAFT_196468 [Colletotrichum somersetense]|nr:hypothetical protein LZ31DRAFT_196468 [Colletotrichum somersetense]
MHTRVDENGTGAKRLMVRVADPFVPNVTRQQEGINNDESLQGPCNLGATKEAVTSRVSGSQTAVAPIDLSNRSPAWLPVFDWRSPPRQKPGANGFCDSVIVWHPSAGLFPDHHARNTPLCARISEGTAQLSNGTWNGNACLWELIVGPECGGPSPGRCRLSAPWTRPCCHIDDVLAAWACRVCLIWELPNHRGTHGSVHVLGRLLRLWRRLTRPRLVA